MKHIFFTISLNSFIFNLTHKKIRHTFSSILHNSLSYEYLKVNFVLFDCAAMVITGIPRFSSSLRSLNILSQEIPLKAVRHNEAISDTFTKELEALDKPSYKSLLECVRKTSTKIIKKIK